MRTLGAIRDIIHAWSMTVATAIVDGLDRIISPRRVTLTEQPDGSFALHEGGKRGAADSFQRPGASRSISVAYDAGELVLNDAAPLLRGSRVEIELLASRFLFRSLDLPAQASDFLDGIVRARIDRLSPWDAGAAMFGCGVPEPIDAQHISTVVAVGARSALIGYVQAALAYRPGAVALLVRPPEQHSARIKVFEQKVSGLLDIPRLNRALLTVLGSAAAAAVLSFGAAVYEASRIDGRQAEVAHDIWQVRSSLQLSDKSRERAPFRALEKRKHETAASTMAIEALAMALPDHTYVTELHLLGSKLQIMGMTQDAPSLIRLLEQSPSFARAAFFAPTTRSPSEPGERFSIEATIRPLGASQ